MVQRLAVCLHTGGGKSSGGAGGGGAGGGGGVPPAVFGEFLAAGGAEVLVSCLLLYRFRAIERQLGVSQCEGRGGGR